MTVEELKSTALQILEDAKRELTKTGSLTQMLFLYSADRSVTIIAVDGEISNSEKEKDKLAEQVRSEIGRRNVVAVLMRTEVWGTQLSAEAARIKQRLRLTVEQADALGLCKKYEAIGISLESPLFQMIITQPYERKGGRIELLAPQVFDSESTEPDEISGRFMSFFPRDQGARA